MMEERYHATTQNRFYPDMSNVNRNITVEAKLFSPPMYNRYKRFTAVFRRPFELDGHVQGSVIGVIEAVYSPA